MKLTSEEAKRVIAFYFESHESPTLTYRRFNIWAIENQSPTRVTKKNVMDTMKRFRRTTLLVKDERQKRSMLDNADTVLDVLGSIGLQRGMSIRKCSEENSLSIGSTHTIARRVLKLYPYRLILVHALSDYDKLVRVGACHQLVPLLSPDRIVVFSDEASFKLDGYVNRWNCRVWDHRRPDELYVEQRQWTPHVNVWAAMTTEHLFGPYFFPSTVSGDSYRAVISELFLPDLISRYGSTNRVWFQQDGAPAHTANETKELLREHFQERLISHGCDNEWPPRSPDLTPCDFYLWGVVQDIVYESGNSFANVTVLSDAILHAFRQLREHKMENVMTAVLAVPRRMQECIALAGAQLQHQ